MVKLIFMTIVLAVLGSASVNADITTYAEFDGTYPPGNLAIGPDGRHKIFLCRPSGPLAGNPTRTGR